MSAINPAIMGKLFGVKNENEEKKDDRHPSTFTPSVAQFIPWFLSRTIYMYTHTVRPIEDYSSRPA